MAPQFRLLRGSLGGPGTPCHRKTLGLRHSDPVTTFSCVLNPSRSGLQVAASRGNHSAPLISEQTSLQNFLWDSSLPTANSLFLSFLWFKPTAQSVEKQKATFTFLHRNNGRTQGVAFPSQGSSGCPAPPHRHFPSPCRLHRLWEDEELGRSCFSFPVALIRCPRPLLQFAFSHRLLPTPPPGPAPPPPPPSGLDRGWYVPHVSWVLVWPATRVPCGQTLPGVRANYQRSGAGASVRVCACVCASVVEGGPTASHFQHCTEEGERERETGDA